MTVDQRDEIWVAAFDTYYDSYFEEICADRLISRWQKLDEASKLIVAITASGSAVTGWALWSQPGFRTLWTIIASTGAVLAIVHAVLGVPGKIKDHGEVKRLFVALRIDLETFRYRMRFDPNFSVEDFTKEFSRYRDRYSSTVQLLKNDLARTRRLERKTQSELNEILSPEIATS
jgi:hypothetical protein